MRSRRHPLLPLLLLALLEKVLRERVGWPRGGIGGGKIRRREGGRRGPMEKGE